MRGYLLRHPEKKRIVDVKGFVKKWDENGNHGNHDNKCTPGFRVPHLKITNVSHEVQELAPARRLLETREASLSAPVLCRFRRSIAPELMG
jgi:hypothetical protein